MPGKSLSIVFEKDEEMDCEANTKTTRFIDDLIPRFLKREDYSSFSNQELKKSKENNHINRHVSRVLNVFNIFKV